MVMVCRSKVWKAPARDFILPRLIKMSTQGAGDRAAVCKISIFNNIMIIVTSWSPQTWSEALATPGLHTLSTLRPTVWSTGCPPSHNDLMSLMLVFHILWALQACFESTCLFIILQTYLLAVQHLWQSVANGHREISRLNRKSINQIGFYPVKRHS